MPKTKRGSANSSKSLTLGELRAHFHLPINDVARKLGVCVTVLKQRCREHGITRWPYRKVRKLDNIISALEADRTGTGGGGGDGSGGDAAVATAAAATTTTATAALEDRSSGGGNSAGSAAQYGGTAKPSDDGSAAEAPREASEEPVTAGEAAVAPAEERADGSGGDVQRAGGHDGEAGAAELRPPQPEAVVTPELRAKLETVWRTRNILLANPNSKAHLQVGKLKTARRKPAALGGAAARAGAATDTAKRNRGGGEQCQTSSNSPVSAGKIPTALALAPSQDGSYMTHPHVAFLPPHLAASLGGFNAFSSAFRPLGHSHSTGSLMTVSGSGATPSPTALDSSTFPRVYGSTNSLVSLESAQQHSAAAGQGAAAAEQQQQQQQAAAAASAAHAYFAQIHAAQMSMMPPGMIPHGMVHPHVMHNWYAMHMAQAHHAASVQNQAQVPGPSSPQGNVP